MLRSEIQWRHNAFLVFLVTEEMVKTYEGFYRYLHEKSGTNIGQHLNNESYRVE